MADETRVRAVVERYFEFVGADVERAEELYHADAVLEFPQTGERFVGRDRFTGWRSQHPVDFDDIQFRVVRVTAREDFAAVELHGSHDRGATWGHGVSLLDFTGDKISRERIYTVEDSPAPEWRAKWRSEGSDPV